MSDIVLLDVGGTIFKTTRSTLSHATYFTSLFDRWQYKPDEPYFIDRDDDGFKHVLRYLRDNNYDIPKEYHYELEFYGINYVKKEEDNEEKTVVSELSNINYAIKDFRDFTVSELSKINNAIEDFSHLFKDKEGNFLLTVKNYYDEILYKIR